jgi:cytochrome c-type protein NapB
MLGYRAQSEPATRPVNAQRPSTSRCKAVPVLVAVLLTASASGYFMGLKQTASLVNAASPTVQSHEPATEASPDVPRVVDYPRLKEVNYKPNADWQNDVRTLSRPQADLSQTNAASDAERALALQARAARRAYEGAPPVVPHPIDQSSSASCLACHEQGAKVKDRFAPKISHAPYSNCTQCHVPSAGTGLLVAAEPLQQPLAENAFAGIPAPGRGMRAFVGAPPTIPHPTLMRGDCTSCHGPAGQFGLRTSHQSRQSCIQCHAPSAVLDQRDLLHAEFPGPLAFGVGTGLSERLTVMPQP